MSGDHAENAGRAFALVIVDELVRHGVTDAVLAPGSRSTPVALALAENARIRLHVRIDERSASFFALGLARTTARPVPLLCTSGTATAHFHAAVMEADQSRIPLILLTADRPPELRGVGANQTVDQLALYGSAVRWACDVGVPEARPASVGYWRSLVSRAVAVATGCSSGPAGPVHLNVPLREPLTPVDDGIGFPHSLAGRDGGQPWTESARAVSTMPDALAERLVNATRGVVVAGDGLSPRDADAVVSFAAGRGWPIVAEPHSNARRGPFALRTVDPLLRGSFADAHRPDLVLVAGRVGLSRVVLGWLADNRHVVVDRDGMWADPTRTAEAVLRVDVSVLADVVGAPATADWAQEWRRASEAAGSAVDRVLDHLGALSEPQVARDVAATMPDGAALVVASSMPIRDLDLTMRPRDGLRIVANRGVSGIDGFVSTALGVAAGHSSGPTVALAGDLSLLHDVNGFLTDDRPDITFVVVNNDGGGIFSLLPQSPSDQSADDERVFEQLFGTPHGVALSRVAATYGLGHDLVADAGHLAECLRAVPHGIRILEVRTDRRANAALHDALRAAVDAAIGDRFA